MEIKIFVGSSGTKYWYIPNEDGIEPVDGTISNFKLHREDGPAIEYHTGDFTYYIMDRCHRIDGPAHQFRGKPYFYVNNKNIDQSVVLEWAEEMGIDDVYNMTENDSIIFQLKFDK